MKLQLILIQKILLIVLLIGFQINYCLAFEVTYNVSNYAGQNIRCHGGNSGWINIVPVGGTFPYTYLWSNGSTLQNQLNLTAGTYTVTVTDASGVTASISIDMTQPDFFSLVLDPKEYEGGYNISEQGGSDGQIETNVGGGTTPYNYLWSTSSTESKISELTAGLYSVTVTDQNGCSLTETVTLIEPTLLHIASIVSPQQKGYNVSCHGGDNGEIDLSVAGGAPPYSYQWSNGNFEEDLHGLTAGEYSVLVTDANDVTTIGQIILTEPQELIVTLNRHVYSNNFHTSCFNCSNGIINSTVAGGSMPYTYTWETGQNTATITNLSAGEYYVLVSDANNCQTSADTRLNAPQREDWSLSGNSNTSTSQYIGTSDAKSLSIKTNNQERIKISANGEIDLNGIVSIDSLKLDHPWSFDTLKIARILPIDGDSIVKIGEGSINFLPQRNRIYGTANPSGLQYHGLGLGLGTVGSGLSSAAIG